MSLTVNRYYTGKNGSAKRFVDEMISSGVVAKIRQEPGNLKYHYFQSLSDPDTILLIDSWENQVALDKHHKSPMMTTIARPCLINMIYICMLSVIVKMMHQMIPIVTLFANNAKTGTSL